MSKARECLRTRSGFEFGKAHRAGVSGGGDAARAQEQWIGDYLRGRSRTLGRRPSVLDVGSSSGGCVNVLSSLGEIEYFGHDPASQPAASGLKPLDAVSRAFPGQRFDVVFAGAMMCRHSPLEVMRLLDDMGALLADGGCIVLVENPLSPVSFREGERDGGWAHDFVGEVAPDWTMDLYPDAVPGHCVYVLSSARETPRRLTLHEVAKEPRDVEEYEIAARALSERGDEVIQPSDERLRGLREDVSFRHQLRGALKDVRVEPGQATAPADWPVASTLAMEAAFVFDAPIDVRFLNEDARFGPVAQVFHKEWFGIRAACGSLPGTKLAISSISPLSASDLDAIVETCRTRGIDRMILHGMSDSMRLFARAMHRAGMSLYIVWHGAAAMWVHEAERRYFEVANQLLASGVVRRLHPIRRGTDIVLGHADAYPKQLLNPVPNARIERAAPRRSESAIAFSPSWNLLHKNLATNIAAANVADRVGTIWTIASDAVLVGATHKKFERLPPQNQLEVMRTMSEADVVLNVSIVDCHPMVDMEALAAGTPCVRGRLFLDILEDHPYVHLTEVQNMLSVEDVARTIDRVLAVPQKEMDDYMRDYATAITRVALDRYAEFAELP